MAVKTNPRPPVQTRRVTGHRAGSLVASVTLFGLAVAALAGGGWASWVDRMDRHAGFVSIGSTSLRTDTYALVGRLRGDGPQWLYGSRVLGKARVRATSQTAQPLFVGIARSADVSRYLNDAGYATIEHLGTGAVATHPGRAPTQPPGQLPIWAASVTGTGQQTLLWKPRTGAWSVVLMSPGATPGVAVRGDVGAKVPILPWLAGGLLLAAAVFAGLGSWLMLRWVGRRRPRPASDEVTRWAATRAPAGAHS